MTAEIVRQAAESLALRHEKACGVKSFYFCEQKKDTLHDDSWLFAYLKIS